MSAYNSTAYNFLKSENPAFAPFGLVSQLNPGPIPEGEYGAAGGVIVGLGGQDLREVGLLASARTVMLELLDLESVLPLVRASLGEPADAGPGQAGWLLLAATPLSEGEGANTQSKGQAGRSKLTVKPFKLAMERRQRLAEVNRGLNFQCSHM